MDSQSSGRAQVNKYRAINVYGYKCVVDMTYIVNCDITSLVSIPKLKFSYSLLDAKNLAANLSILSIYQSLFDLGYKSLQSLGYAYI